MGKAGKKQYFTKDGKSILIRDAEPKDAASLIDINTKVINEKLYMLRESDETNYTIDREAENIERHHSSEGAVFIVAEADGMIAGYLEFENGIFKRTKHSGMFSMFILDEWRNKGIGRLLLKTLIEWAEKNETIEKITLAVFSTNERALSLYEKLGFIEEGRCPRDMKLDDGSYMDSVLMYKFVK
jgi:RimJ/RimL family protein N-acetyltransferase